MLVPINPQIPFVNTVIADKEKNNGSSAEVNTVASLFLNVFQNVSLETDSKPVGNDKELRIFETGHSVALVEGSGSDLSILRVEGSGSDHSILQNAVDSQDGSGEPEKIYVLSEELDLTLLNGGVRTIARGTGTVQSLTAVLQIPTVQKRETEPVTFNGKYEPDFDINLQEIHGLVLDGESADVKLEIFEPEKSRRLNAIALKIKADQDNFTFGIETLHQGIRIKDLPIIHTNPYRIAVAVDEGETESLITGFSSKLFDVVFPNKKESGSSQDGKNGELSRVVKNKYVPSKDFKFPQNLVLKPSEATITKFVILGDPSAGQVSAEPEATQFSLGRNTVYKSEIKGEFPLNVKRDAISKGSPVIPRFFNENHNGSNWISHLSALAKNGKENINEPPLPHEVGLEEFFSEEIAPNTKLFRVDHQKVDNFRVLEIDPFLNMKLKIKDIKHSKNQPSNFLNADFNIVPQNVNSINFINNVVTQSNPGELLEPWLDSLIETDRRQWAERLTDQIKTSFRNGGGNAIELRLHPASLGKLMVSIVQTDKGFAIRIHTQTHAASKLVTDSDGKLTMLLSEAGLKLESLRVVSDNFAGRSFENNFGTERQNENSKGSGKSPFDESGEKAEEDQITLVGDEVLHLPEGYKYKIDIYV